MKKFLVSYFSVSGVTKTVAKRLTEVENADIYEIRAKFPYTSADLDWTDSNSRSTLEMKNKSSRPEIADHDADVESASAIFIGFPIWWYREPSIIDTFLESYDFNHKKIIPFCTSGTSDIGDTAKRMQEIVGIGAKVLEGKRFSANVSDDELKTWVQSLNL